MFKELFTESIKTYAKKIGDKHIIDVDDGKDQDFVYYVSSNNRDEALAMVSVIKSQKDIEKYLKSGKLVKGK